MRFKRFTVASVLLVIRLAIFYFYDYYYYMNILCQDNCYGHKTTINTGPDGKLDVKLDMNSRWTRTREELELMQGRQKQHVAAGAAIYGGHFIIQSLVKIVSTKLLK